MTTAPEITQAALALPVEERALLARELLTSLETTLGERTPEIEAAWAHEVSRRAERVLAGEPDGIAWEDLRTELAAGRTTGSL